MAHEDLAPGVVSGRFGITITGMLETLTPGMAMALADELVAHADECCEEPNAVVARRHGIDIEGPTSGLTADRARTLAEMLRNTAMRSIVGGLPTDGQAPGLDAPGDDDGTVVNFPGR